MDWQRVFDGRNGWEETGLSLALAGVALFLGLVVHGGGFFILRRWSLSRESPAGKLFHRHWRAPMRFGLPLASLMVVLPSLRLPEGVLELTRHLLGIGLILNAGWLLAATVFLVRSAILSRYDISVSDNLKARAMHTQVNVLVKVLLVAIAVLTLASLLMTFEKVRQVGVSLLASAGVVGVIAGFAAQRSLATLFAGIQIAVTQPIRIDDVVIVEGEWGKIEEITLTYVVIRIWDLRRLVVPINYFLEKPFQNWTRVSADLLGTVTLHTDYTVPVEALREELYRLLGKSTHWDGKVWGLQVTGATERTMEVRALMSAPDASTAWNLRCEIREKLIDYLRRTCPESLPRLRAELPPRGRPEQGSEGGRRAREQETL